MNLMFRNYCIFQNMMKFTVLTILYYWFHVAAMYSCALDNKAKLPQSRTTSHPNKDRTAKSNDSYFESSFYKNMKSELNLHYECKDHYTDEGLPPDIYHGNKFCPNHFASRAFAKQKCCEECHMSHPELWRVNCEGWPTGSGRFEEDIRVKFHCFTNYHERNNAKSNCTTSGNYTWASILEDFKVYCQIADVKPPVCPVPGAINPVHVAPKPVAPTTKKAKGSSKAPKPSKRHPSTSANKKG